MSYNKYKNNKVVVEGIKFDSETESHYYIYIKKLKEEGEVVAFELQPTYILQEGFIKDGKKIRPIIYKADFKVIYKDGHEEIIDVKGQITAEFKIKRKLLLYKYPNIDFRVIVKEGKKGNYKWVEIMN